MKRIHAPHALVAAALATAASPAFADVLDTLEATFGSASWPMWLGAGSALLLLVALVMSAMRSNASQPPETIRPRFGEMRLRDDAQ